MWIIAYPEEDCIQLVLTFFYFESDSSFGGEKQPSPGGRGYG
jgi:hypothetical protein